METTRALREEFDRGRDFVVARAFTCNNKELVPGVPFDKTQVPTRRLRQLFDLRMISMAGGQEKVREFTPTTRGEIEFGNVPAPKREPEAGDDALYSEKFFNKPPEEPTDEPAPQPVNVKQPVEGSSLQMPDFDAMDDAGLRAYLSANGVIPRSNWSQPRLVTRAKGVWQNKMRG